MQLIYKQFKKARTCLRKWQGRWRQGHEVRGCSRDVPVLAQWQNEFYFSLLGLAVISVP